MNYLPVLQRDHKSFRSTECEKFDVNEDEGRALQSSSLPDDLIKVLESDFWTKLLRDFAASEYTPENIDFLLRVKNFQQSPSQTKARQMYYDFIDDQSATQLNLDFSIVNEIKTQLQALSIIGQAPQPTGAWKAARPTGAWKTARPVGVLLKDVFNNAEQHIYKLVKNDTFTRFKKRINEIKEERK